MTARKKVVQKKWRNRPACVVVVGNGVRDAGLFLPTKAGESLAWA